MPTVQILILGLVFFAVVFAGLGAWLLLGGKGAMGGGKVRERLQGVRQIRDYNLGETLAEAEDKKKLEKEKRRDVVRKKAFSDIPSLENQFGSKPWVEKLNARLRQAQMPLSVGQFIGLCVGCGMVGALLSVVLTRGIHLLYTPVALAALGLAPYGYLSVSVSRRISKFSGQFADALDLLAGCVKSGQSLNAAIQNVADEMPDPVGDEFRIMADELTFGEDLSKVLGHFRDRMSTEDVQIFCTALQIQKDVGGNLTEVLDGLQKTIRERFRILRQVRTLTAQGRLSGWIVGGLPIALGGVIYLCNPEYMGTLFTTESGQTLIIVALVGEAIGMFIIRKIVDIKV